MKECPNCEEPVSKDFMRVFADNNGYVPGCFSCRSLNELTDWPVKEPPNVVE